MLIPPTELNSAIENKPGKILHIGAHTGEEYLEYCKAGWGIKKIVWIEAQQNLADALALKLPKNQNQVICCAAWSKSNLEKIFYVTSNSESSSFLEFENHESLYPHISVINEIKMHTKRLDEVLETDFEPEFINIDVQGAEIDVLKGCGRFIDSAHFIYTEVNKEYLYKSNSLISELDSYLANYGYRRLLTRWYLNHGWGDALYVNMKKVRISKIKLIKILLSNLKLSLSFLMKQIQNLVIKL